MKLKMLLCSLFMIGSSTLMAQESNTFKASLNTEYCCENECIVKVNISNEVIDLSKMKISVVSPETNYLYHKCDKNKCIAAFHTSKSNKTVKLNLTNTDSKWEMELLFDPALYGILDMQ